VVIISEIALDVIVGPTVAGDVFAPGVFGTGGGDGGGGGVGVAGVGAVGVPGYESCVSTKLQQHLMRGLILYPESH
jgi:hypothetical protein